MFLRFPFYCSGKIYVFSLKNIRYNIKWKAISFDKAGAVTIMRTYNFRMGESSHDTDF